MVKWKPLHNHFLILYRKIFSVVTEECWYEHALAYYSSIAPGRLWSTRIFFLLCMLKEEKALHLILLISHCAVFLHGCCSSYSWWHMWYSEQTSKDPPPYPGQIVGAKAEVELFSLHHSTTRVCLLFISDNSNTVNVIIVNWIFTPDES